MAQPSTVTIRSEWAGLGAAVPEEMQFLCSPSLDVARSSRCRRLRAVLEAAAAEETPASDTLGVTQEWLNANVEDALRRDLPDVDRPYSRQQLSLFRAAFTNESLIPRMVANTQSWHTDDYPSVSIEVVDADGSVTTLKSESQGPFMSPWTFTRGGAHRVVAGRSVGDALFQLLPRRFLNRKRIGGEQFRTEYSEAVLSHIREEWDLAHAADQLGSYFDELNSRFKISESRIVSISSIDTNGYGWWGKIRFPDSSVRGDVGFFFPMYRKDPPNLDGFYAEIGALVERVRTVDWLTRYLAANDTTRIELRFVDSRSLSKKAAASVIEDLRAHDREGLATRVAREQETCAFLEIENGPRRWSRWLLFANGDMLLWHAQADVVLGYPQSIHPTWDYHGWNGIGLLVSRAGTISGEPRR